MIATRAVPRPTIQFKDTNKRGIVDSPYRRHRVLTSKSISLESGWRLAEDSPYESRLAEYNTYFLVSLGRLFGGNYFPTIVSSFSSCAWLGNWSRVQNPRLPMPPWRSQHPLRTGSLAGQIPSESNA